MFNGPHYTLHYDVGVLAYYKELLIMEQLVPGVTTWTHVGGSGPGAMKALRNRIERTGYTDDLDAASIASSRPQGFEAIQRVWQTVPANCAHLMSTAPTGSLPASIAAVSRFMTRKTDNFSDPRTSLAFRWLPKVTEAMETSEWVAKGTARIERLVASGVMKREAADKLLVRWYQVALSAFIDGLPGVCLRADGGTGKSVGVLTALLALGYKRILVLCPAEVRDPFVGWPMEVNVWTTLAPFAFLPPKSPLRNRARWQHAHDYAAEMAGKQAALVGICAYDNISEYLAEIEDFKPDALIIDEIDKVGKNSKRFEASIDASGARVYSAVTTEKKGRANRASGMNTVRNLRSVRTCVTTSATAIDTGDPEHIWGILDLTAPGCVGTKYAFLARYKCGPPMVDAKYPQYAAKSPSFMSELKGRMKAIYIDIPHSVTKRFVLDANVYTVRIPVEAQASTRGLGLAALAKKAIKDGDRKTGFELELAMAAMAKAKYGVPRIVNALKAGKRVVAYANRIEVVEWLFEKILREYGVEFDESQSDSQSSGQSQSNSQNTADSVRTGANFAYSADSDDEWPDAEPAEDNEPTPDFVDESPFDDNQALPTRPTDAVDLAQTLAAKIDPRSLAAAKAGIWAVCLHSQMKRPGSKGALIHEFANLPIYASDPIRSETVLGHGVGPRLGALVMGSRDSIGRGTNGLQESDLAVYFQLGKSPGPLLQTIYRHQRPKPRLPLATDFEILIAEGTVDERVESDTINLGVAAAAIAPTEGLVAALNAIRESSQMSAGELAARFDGEPEEGEEGDSGSGWEGDNEFDDEDVPF